MATLGELFIELGVIADTEELKGFENRLKKLKSHIQDTTKKTDKAVKKNEDFNKSLKKVITTARNISLAITGALYAVNRLTDSLVQSNQQMLNLTRNSDIAMGTFQKWNNVGKMLGVQNAAQQIEGLNQKLFRLRLTGEGAEGFMLAGINPMGQDAEGVMEQLRNRVSGLNDTAATYLLQQMGLDPSMLHLLRMTRQEFEELGATVRKYQLTPEQSKQIQEMNKQLEIAKIKLQYLKDRAIIALLPVWTKFLQLCVKTSEVIENFVKKINFKALGATLAVFSLKFIPFMKILKAIPGVLTNIIAKLPTIKGFLLRIGAVLARTLAPLTALYLLFDDIFTYFEGGDSVLGLVLEAVDEIKKGVDNLLSSEDTPQWLKDLLRAGEIWKEFKDNKEFEELQKNNPLKELTPEDMKKLEDKTRRLVIGQQLNYSDRLHSLLLSQPGQIYNNSTTNYNYNNNISQNNSISSTQPAFDIQRELGFINFGLLAG